MLSKWLGKTTLLNVLAHRASVGVVGGDMMTEAKFQDAGFGRKVGYAQQQDLHLPTATVREALMFSARLRQPANYSEQQQMAYVDGIIETLDMSKFADAIIGPPGHGLNAEQRKRVTIGVELAARPELLLFLDEPTSGLDSNTAWSICQLLRKLADEGQTILCTIHQPSAANFMTFDRLLVLIEGRSAYFGDIGPNCSTMIDYFERHGAKPCEAQENPAEWLLTTCTNLPPSDTSEWADIWQHSDERRAVQSTIQAMEADLCQTSSGCPRVEATEFATSFCTQLVVLVQRNFTNDWRLPPYLYSKILLTVGAVRSQHSEACSPCPL